MALVCGIATTAASCGAATIDGVCDPAGVDEEPAVDSEPVAAALVSFFLPPATSANTPPPIARTPIATPAMIAPLRRRGGIPAPVVTAPAAELSVVGLAPGVAIRVCASWGAGVGFCRYAIAAAGVM